MIYQYASLGKYHLSNLKNRWIHFSNVNTFNDPFDSEIRVRHEGTEEQWRNYLKKNGESSKSIEQKIWMLKAIAVANNTDQNRLYFPRKENIRYNAYVSCFSRRFDSILMWSHYAHNHTGFARGFEPKVDENLEYIDIEKGQLEYLGLGDIGRFVLFDVLYSSDPPPTANGLIEDQYVERFLKTKYIDWAYEQEVRAFCLNSWMKNEDIIHSIDCLKELIFGLKTPIEDMKSMTVALKESGARDVKLYRCERLPDSFLIQKREIVDIDAEINNNGS
ncbi:DUF2971 domain-containing protein [Leptospira sp. GIMC2001]|uniref:DUF2971 domain-containing protein n=1 Tax=Leptospira sp. GIMC2001 TaxID=1513297 RepID=UPI00234B97D1|nr:DUF2971 domain-containing protein [Leptospira sp. GIMC2001]WCL50809.1 DUF2971 domain-containing protein [Leptospira sp. GIMC2001]